VEVRSGAEREAEDPAAIFEVAELDSHEPQRGAPTTNGNCLGCLEPYEGPPAANGNCLTCSLS